MTSKKGGKRGVTEYRGWRIRKRPAGTWMADNCDRKARVRIVLPTLEKAQSEIDRRETRLENLGKQGDKLTDRQRLDAAEVVEELGGRATIKDALEFWKQHHPDGEGAQIGDMARKWTDWQTKADYRAATIRQNKHRMAVFAEVFGENTPVSAITRQNVLDFISSREGVKQTRKGWRAVVHAFFEFCCGDDEADPPIPSVIDFNPLAKKRAKRKGGKPVRDEKQPEIWDAATVQKFLWKCEELHPEDCAAFAVGFFAGLRPTELGGQYGIEPEAVRLAKDALEPYSAALKKARAVKMKTQENTPARRAAEAARQRAWDLRKPYLDALHEARKAARRAARAVSQMATDRLKWGDIDLGAGTIHVRPETSKMRAARFVNIAPNLMVWLLKYRRPSGPVAAPQPTLKRHRKEIMKAAKIDTWPADVGRHSFASFHLAAHEDIAKTQLQLGHTGDADVLFNHYRALASKAAAQKYWGIQPKGTAQAGGQVERAQAGA